MDEYSSLSNRTNTRLPADHWAAHQLCFVIHDVMLQSLISGRQASIFSGHIKFRDEEDRASFEGATDIFDWLENSNREDDRADLLVNLVFPNLLGDMFDCLYEALETSRKGKLTVSFMLLRKPLQECLFLLESMVIDRHDYAGKLATNPLQLWSQRGHDLDAHTKRITKVLEILGESERFDANFLAQLRYDKSAPDGFDGVCNKAMHLFTGHKAIQTAPLNVNFIFSEYNEKLTQWAYLYSRLPYLLAYLHCVVEHIYATIALTTPAYIEDMNRRIAALVVLWWEGVKPPHDEPRLHTFFHHTQAWLHNHCSKQGYRPPGHADLLRMADSGAYPGEAEDEVAERQQQFVQAAISCGSAQQETSGS
ncbi:hypothetical protein [Methylovirgula sp. 4M-Z18]|uniref:hypothetical protein n=1 Tax=Methylovirgula sp. 4M-Z18 TaxID=2293567 RepID=UPI0011C06317|nr:hypothetical protein [Methylovirgula sp. 4M-Z18]